MSLINNGLECDSYVKLSKIVDIVWNLHLKFVTSKLRVCVILKECDLLGLIRLRGVFYW